MTTLTKLQFGRWTVNAKACALEISPTGQGHDIYQVRLEEMESSAAILDWVFQLNEKTWTTPADIGHLVEAIDEIFGRGIAGGGIDHPRDPKPLLEKRLGITF